MMNKHIPHQLNWKDFCCLPCSK